MTDEARALLHLASTITTVPTLSATDTTARLKAERDLWSWYLEWSRIARVAVTRRASLRQLGFVAPRVDPTDDEEPEHADGPRSNAAD